MGTIILITQSGICDSTTSITDIICGTILIITLINAILICILRANKLSHKNKFYEIETKHLQEIERLKLEAMKLDELKLYRQQLANFLEKQAITAEVKLNEDKQSEIRMRTFNLTDASKYKIHLENRIRELSTTDQIQQSNAQEPAKPCTFCRHIKEFFRKLFPKKQEKKEQTQ